jgi:bleomycin hydrolase
MLRFLLILFELLIIVSFLTAQTVKRDKGIFIEYKNEFWEEIKGSVEKFEAKEKEEKKSFKMDFTDYELPKSTEEFTKYWHNTPISQGWSGMCWNFSATSFFESEIFRIHNKKIKISELHTTYWEYIEKARRFVREKGNSLFSEGSQANAVTRIWKQYGCVPADVYTGMHPEQKFHGHDKMYNEIKSYLNSVKKNNVWNEELVLSTIKSILNSYIGEPPSEFEFENKKMTAKEFLKNIVNLNLDDYIELFSLMEEPFYKKVEYKVADNWWHNKDYYNVPVDEFMKALKSAIQDGYTVAIGGDVSESGYDSHAEVAMIPTYDIPSDYIDDYARQFRFGNRTTTDDHGIHVVGYKKQDEEFWFLIKDSGSGSRNGPNKGYYFYHEDYIKLKMMSFTVHKDAVKEILKSFK